MHAGTTQDVCMGKELMLEAQPASKTSAPAPQPATKPEHHRFHLLDALRGIAAVIVLMLHAPSQYSGPFLFQNSYLAVDFFFCLSGFVIAFSYEKRLSTFMSLRQFMLARAIRLYPLAALGTVLGSAFLFAGLHNHGRTVTGISGVVHLFLGLLLIPSTRYDVLFPLNPVVWTLFFELLANLFYGALVRMQLARTSVFLLIVLCAFAFLAWTCTRFGTFDLGYSTKYFMVGAARAGFSFFLGTLTFRVYALQMFARTHGAKALAISGAVIAALCLILCDVFAVTKLASVQLLIAGTVFPGIVYAGAHVAIAQAALCSFLGSISYPLYILHDVLLEPLFLPSSLRFAISHQDLAPIAMLFVLSLLLLVSWLSIEYWDKPVRSALTNGFAAIVV